MRWLLLLLLCGCATSRDEVAPDKMLAGSEHLQGESAARLDAMMTKETETGIRPTVADTRRLHRYVVNRVGAIGQDVEHVGSRHETCHSPGGR